MIPAPMTRKSALKTEISRIGGKMPPIHLADYLDAFLPELGAGT